MGPVREISLTAADDEALDLIHATLLQVADKVVATRDGRVWDIWCNAQPFHIEIDPVALAITVSAGCNRAEDHALLEQIGNALINQLVKYVEPRNDI